MKHGVGRAEIAVLVVLAVVLFGPEKLPGIARKAARVLRYVRTIANDASGQIRRELGPEYADFDVRDLNPRAFVSKHLLSDVEPIVADVKSELREVDRIGRQTSQDLKKQLGESETDRSARSSGHPTRRSTANQTAAKSAAPAGVNGTRANGVAAATTTVVAEQSEGAAAQVAVAPRPQTAALNNSGAELETTPVEGPEQIDSRVPWDHEAT